MDSRTLALARESYAPLAPRAAEVAERFFNNLFARQASVRPFFPADISDYKRQLPSVVQTMLDSADKPQTIETSLRELGRQYGKAGAQIVHYGAVARTLIDTLREMSGLEWQARYTRAWDSLLDAVIKTMLRAAAGKPASASATPPTITRPTASSGAQSPATRPGAKKPAKSKQAA